MTTTYSPYRPLRDGSDRDAPFLAGHFNDPGMTLLSIVVPCYNEENGISALYERCVAAASAQPNSPFELILIDDGSRDHTWQVIAELCQKDPRVVGIRLSRNYGHQLALTAGLKHVRGAEVFVIDADLQDPPELLADMRRAMATEGADVVYGVRRSRAGEGRFKLWSAKLFYRLLAKATEIDIPLDSGDFRLMTRRASDLIANMPERDRFIRGMVAWLGFKQVPFEYDRKERFSGETKYPLHKMLRLAIDAFVGFSIVPIRMAGYLAMLTFVALFGLLLFSLVGWLYWGTVPGWTSLTILILFVSGVQLALLSIISEFVGRTYLQLKQRPLFLVDLIVRDGKALREAPRVSDLDVMRMAGAERSKFEPAQVKT